MAVPLVRLEVTVPVMGDETAQPLAHVQQTEFCPKIHKAVGRWRSGKANHPFYGGAYLEEASEPFCLVGL